MTWQQQEIDERYSGSKTHFEADFAKAVTEGNLHAVHWDDLLANATTLPHLRETGRDVIKINLGYLPPDDVMLPYEPYLRSLIQHYWNGQIEEENFLDEVEDHIKLIRNADMKHNTCLVYDEAIYRNYHATFAPYGYAARERLSRFLGYEPQPEHSLIAEMWMRHIMADQTYRLPDEITSDDIRAMTLTRYREILLEHGKMTADSSPLLQTMTE